MGAGWQPLRARQRRLPRQAGGAAPTSGGRQHLCHWPRTLHSQQLCQAHPWMLNLLQTLLSGPTSLSQGCRLGQGAQLQEWTLQLPAALQRRWCSGWH